MVNHILKYVEADGNFDSVFLHVQVNNESAIEFYKKFGFEIVETKQKYYKRIEPADAHVLQKTLSKKCSSNTTTTMCSTINSHTTSEVAHHLNGVKA